MIYHHYSYCYLVQKHTLVGLAMQFFIIFIITIIIIITTIIILYTNT